MRAIIVDDEPQSHLALRELLSQSHPEVEIIASGNSVKQGCQLIQQHAPDILFLDIEMPDGLGFDVLKRFHGHTFQVIFITAHNEYAITAIKFGALDYLLKPVEREELAKALERVKKKLNERISKDQVQILFESILNQEVKRLPSRIAISTSEGILYKQISDIIRLEAHQNYTEFTIHKHTKKILASHNIGYFSEQFESYKEFKKSHRSHVVNLCFVEKYVKADGGYLVMKNGDEVPVSRSNRNDLLGGLDDL